MSSITAGTSAGTALVHTADTTGSFVVKTGAGSTTGLTVDGSQIVTLAQPLPVGSGGTGATSLSGLTVGTATSATSATTATNLAGGSNGTIPYQSASGTTQMLAVGTAGQLLQTNGAGAPTWVNASSGALTLLSTVTASNSATIDIEAFSATYDNYVLIVTGVRPSASGNTLRCRFKLSGAYDTSGSYKYHVHTSNQNATTYSAFNGSTTSITMCSALDNTQSQSNFSCVMNILYVNTASLYRGVTWNGLTIDSSSGETAMANGFGQNGGTASALTGVRLYMGAGNISTGTFKLYGLANS